MAYGLLVKNGSNRVQIDSDSAYPTLYQTAGATVASGTAIAAGTYQNLFFARPTITTGSTSIYRQNGNIISSSGSTIEYRIFKETTDGLVAPGTGYGLNIYNSTGGCIFSATSSSYASSMEFIVTGLFEFTGLFLDIPMPSSTYALSTGRIYALLNTASYRAGPSGNRVFYEYLFGTGTYGTIRVWSYATYRDGEPGGITQTWDEPVSNGNTFIIGYLRG